MDKLTIVGQHDDRTIAQMRNCLRDERATAGVLCADGHLGYAQPVGGIIAYYDSISVSLKREAASQLGTVGSGNHYVDVLEAEHDGSIWLGVHFGSRGLGHKIASHYTKLAGGKNGIDLEPAVLAAESDLGREYLVAMDLAGLYAYAGREWVVHTIVRDFMHAGITDAVHNHHNYAWKEQIGGAEQYVVRKGATPLYPGQRGFVGGSMGDISVILKGKPQGMAARLLNSTIHGSGRVMSRTQAAGKSRWVKGRKVSQGGGHIRHRDGAVAEDCCDGRLGRARPLQGLTWFVRLVALAGDWLLR